MFANIHINHTVYFKYNDMVIILIFIENKKNQLLTSILTVRRKEENRTKGF